LHTDWDKVPGWSNIGYPVAACRADGSFTVSKPPGTGGLVSAATVSEQLLYEIGDPRSYIVPDVICDLTQVTITSSGQDEVDVRGARGRAPTPYYKVSSTYLDGFGCTAQMTIVGFDAARKARRTAEAILERTRKLFSEHNYGDYTDTNIETIGAESCYGPHSTAEGAREVTMRLSVRHPIKKALELFSREISAAGTSWSPGTTGSGGGGRSRPSPSIKQFAFLLEKRSLTPIVSVGGKRIPIEIPSGALHEEHGEAVASKTPGVGLAANAATVPEATVEVPLIRIAYGRSGDKGDTSNIGLIARSPNLLPHLRAEVTEERVGAWLSHLVKGNITRYDLPGIGAINFLCEAALGGGGMASLRNDPLGKGMAQILLAMPVRVPKELLEAV
jgi:hypothetical protein